MAILQSDPYSKQPHNLQSPSLANLLLLTTLTSSPQFKPYTFSSRPWTTHKTESGMGRYRRTTSPTLAAVALLLLICAFHCGAAAARLLPAPPVHRENGVDDAAEGMVLQEGAAGNGDELSNSEMMGAEEEVEACGEGNDDECAQRRLLRDAHLDYIYTQHKGKP